MSGADNTPRVESCHYGWNRAHEPVLRVAPGTVVTFVLGDPSDGQITSASTTEVLDEIDWGRVPPLYGPVAVAGARPGDALQVTVLDIVLGDWGWSANLRDFGLLSADHPEPALHIWDLGRSGGAGAGSGAQGAESSSGAPLTAEFAPGIRVPLKPFAGEMGVVPAIWGLHDAIAPRRVGGNLDTRDLGVGSTLWLPVEVDEALFSCGDGHAAQGDGEVCGTAIEASMTVTLRLDLVENAGLDAPRFETNGPVTRHLDGAGYDVTMGVGPDLMEAARGAVRDMVARLSAARGLAPVDAYLLCSVCGDLRISEIVDAPNWVVSFYFPKSVFV